MVRETLNSFYRHSSSVVVSSTVKVVIPDPNDGRRMEYSTVPLTAGAVRTLREGTSCLKTVKTLPAEQHTET